MVTIENGPVLGCDAGLGSRSRYSDLDLGLVGLILDGIGPWAWAQQKIRITTQFKNYDIKITSYD